MVQRGHTRPELVAERGERIGGTYRTKCPKTPTAASGYTASGGASADGCARLSGGQAALAGGGKKHAGQLLLRRPLGDGRDVIPLRLSPLPRDIHRRSAPWTKTVRGGIRLPGRRRAGGGPDRAAAGCRRPPA